MKSNLKKILYLTAAFFFFGIGAIGAVLPVLPTTPFLLLASFCFAKGSKRFHNWFLSTKIYKKYLADFVRSRSMTLKTKFSILIPASLMMSLAFIFAPIWHVKAAIFLLVLFKYYYFFFRIKTIPSGKVQNIESTNQYIDLEEK